jgi:hypothetical protein
MSARRFLRRRERHAAVGRKLRRRSRLAGTIVAFAAVSVTVFFVASAFGVLESSPGKFEAGDANMTLAASGNTDWNCFTNFTGITVGGSCGVSGHFNTGAPALVADANAYTTKDLSWKAGQKMDTECPTLEPSKDQAKDTFTYVTSYNETNFETAHAYLYGSTIRYAANGNASENVELNHRAGTKACSILRTAGDKLIAIDYLNGGTKVEFHVLTWITSQTGPEATVGENTGTCYVSKDVPPCWGAKVLSLAESAAEGAASQSEITAAQNGISHAALVSGAFAEFGVDLTKAKITPANTCEVFPQSVWESRASGSSFESNPADIEIEAHKISNCLSSTTTTHPQQGGSNVSSISLGQSVNDHAQVDGTAAAGAPTGSVEFFLCSPTQLTSGACESGGSAVGTSVALTRIGTTSSSSADSASATPSSPGTWCFRAVYKPASGSFYLSSSDGSATECFTVTSASSTTKTTPSSSSIVLGNSITDKANVSGIGGSFPAPSGEVTFYVCGPSASSCTSGGTQVGAVKTLSGGTASSDSYTPTQAGSYCFRAEYGGDGNYGGSKDGSATECFTVTSASSTTKTTPSSSSIVLGNSITDTAVVTEGGLFSGIGGGFPAPSGEVTFYVCGPGVTECATGGTQVGAVKTLSGGAAESDPFSPTQAGSYCFRAEYAGDGNYEGSKDGSATECFTVTKLDSTISTAQSWVPQDTATLDHSGGAVVFTLLKNVSDAATCVGGTTVYGPTASIAVADQSGKGSGPFTASTTNTTFTVTSVSSGDTYFWKAQYTSGDAQHKDVASNCQEATGFSSLSNGAPVKSS